MIRSIGEAMPQDQGIAHAPRISVVAKTQTGNAVSGIHVVRVVDRQRVSVSPEIVSSLRRFVARRVKNADDAADISQQAMLLAYEERSTCDIESLSSWLFTVARHLIVDHFRSQNRFRFMVLRSTVVDAEPALQTRPNLALVIAQCHEELGFLLHRIVRLTWLEHQVAVLMSDVYGYGDKHSATELRMSVPCFKLMLHGARLSLRHISHRSGSGIAPVCALRRLGVTCGLPEPQLFAVRGMLLEGLRGDRSRYHRVVSLLVRGGLLCVAGAVVGVAGNGMSPRPARLGTPVHAAADSAGAACQDPRATVARISVQEAKPLCIACTAAFVDARSAQEYAAGHITGAVHLAPGQPAEPLLPKLSAAPAVIVYDRDRDCAAADRVAVLLQSNGVRDVRVLTGAWPEWLARGGPGESGTCALCAAGGQ